MKTGKSINSVVLSTRIPSDVMSTIDDICKQQGVNRSQWLTTMVVSKQSNELMKKGGTVQARTIPIEIQDLLTAGGVTVVGILSYNLVGSALTKAVDKDGNSKFTHGEIQFISTITALAIAMAGYGVIKQLTKDI